MSYDPDIYDNISNADYQADPALGHSGTVTLMDECPARFQWERANTPEQKREFDIGTAVHLLLLEPMKFEDEIAVVPFKDYRTKAAQEEREAAYMVDRTPLLPHQMEAVQTMAKAVMRHPIAGRLLTGGIAEQSLFWKDEETGVMRKCRPDYRIERPLRNFTAQPPSNGGHLRKGQNTIINLKTAASAHPDAIRRVAWDNHWWSSEQYTREGLAAHDIAVSDYLYIVVEKEPPHFVVVYRLPERMIEMGHIFNRKAVHLFAECHKSGIWPAFPERVHEIDPPGWTEVRFEEDRVAGRFNIDPTRPGFMT